MKTVNDDSVTLQSLRESGNTTVSEELCSALREDFKDVAMRGRDHWRGYHDADSTRLNLWAGQDRDGRKWNKNMDGNKALPWDGASDMRIWLVDLLVKAKVAFAMEIIARSQVAVQPLTGQDVRRAGLVEVLHKWITKNLWRSRGRRQLKIAMNWMNTDGAAILYSFYDRQTVVSNEVVTDADIVEEYLMLISPDPEETEGEFAERLRATREAIAIQLRATDKEGRAEAVEILAARWPELSTARHRRMLRELQKEGATRVPLQLPVQEGPRPNALRVGEDIFFEPGVDDLQEAPGIYHVERLSRAQALIRAEKEDWADGFTKQLLGDGRLEAGKWGEFSVNTDDERGLSDPEGELDQKRVEVVTGLRKAVDEEGRMGVYRVVFHPSIKVAATEDELLEDSYGVYPMVAFAREVLSARFLDSRGIPEVAGPTQALAKWLRDMAMNVTSLMTVPPVKAPVNRPESQLLIAPNGVVRQRQKGDVEVMSGWKYPKEALDLAAAIQEDVMRLFGLSYDDAHRPVSEAMQQDEAKDLLAGMEDFYMLVLTQTLHHMDPALLEEIVGEPLDVTPRELNHRIGITLSFDPRHLNSEFVKSWLETMTTLILPNDPRNVVLRDELARIGTQMLDPSLASRLTRDTESAGEAEVKAEQDQIGAVLMGFEPELLEFSDGADFTTRFQILQQWMADNPQRVEALDEVTRERMARHYDNLEQMVEQMQNVQTGKTGVADETQTQPMEA